MTVSNSQMSEERILDHTLSILRTDFNNQFLSQFETVNGVTVSLPAPDQFFQDSIRDPVNSDLFAFVYSEITVGEEQTYGSSDVVNVVVLIVKGTEDFSDENIRILRRYRQALKAFFEDQSRALFPQTSSYLSVKQYPPLPLSKVVDNMSGYLTVGVSFEITIS